ncbi:MAG: PDZ domain-containing protein [Patulibacter minatonensis]
MPLPRSASARLLVLTGAVGLGVGLGACGKDEPLGADRGSSPKPLSNQTTTAELTDAAVEHALPSVVAVSVTRGGETRTGTGTVLARGIIVTDAQLVASRTVTTTVTTSGVSSSGTGSSSGSGASKNENTANASSGTPKSSAPAGTTPRPTADAARAAGTTPKSSATAKASAGTPTPAGTTPASTPTPKPKPRTTTVKIATPPSVTVREADGTEHEATVDGTDPLSGLAVVRVDGLDTVPVARGGAAARLGQQVGSVGYLSARRPAVRPGTVVTTGRSVRANRETEVGLMEATAPLGGQGIGGPLVDGRGQVVAITTRSLPAVIPGTVVAVPYAAAMRISKALADGGRVRRAYLGLETVGITPNRAEELQLRTSGGVLIRAIVPGSPAAFSTLRGPSGSTQIGGRQIPTGSDAITKIDGREIKEPEDLDAALSTMKPGHRATLQVIRGTRGVEVHVTLGER